jgi:putative transposase
MATPTLDNYRNINAVAESTIGLYKTELINQQGPWKTMEQVEFATLQ